MEYLCGGIVLLVIVVGIFAAIKQKALAAALQAYQVSLERLEADPNNPQLRQQALRLGRDYLNLTRNKQGVTVYDEVALKNDIDAVCAGAVSVQNRSVEERFVKLQQLLSAGHITEGEYQRRKQSILRRGVARRRGLIRV